jgi:cell wall-associated NlpC family hydrolase
MKRVLAIAALACAGATAEEPSFGERLRDAVRAHLGRPYVWGATGLKSYDCSGFVWRVHVDAGTPFKRTTARKLWFSLPQPPKGKEHEFGNLVFFDDLHHVGIVNDKETFFHSAKSTGTAQCGLRPYWHKLFGGIRSGPAPAP